MSVHDLPAVNASLNATATVLMTAGFIFILRGNVVAHRRCMLSAAVVSALFLVGYITHKVVEGHSQFGGHGAIRTFYLTMLTTHIILAIAIVFLVPRTFIFAMQGKFDRHRAWAKWTFPIWYYVSVTGVLVYFFLYRWWPAT